MTKRQASKYRNDFGSAWKMDNHRKLESPRRIFKDTPDYQERRQKAQEMQKHFKWNGGF